MKKVILIFLLITSLNANYSRWIGCWTQEGKPVFYLSIEDKKWLAKYSLNQKLIPEVEIKYTKTTTSEQTGNKFDYYMDHKKKIAFIFQRSVMKGQMNTLEIYKGSNSQKYLCEDLK